MEYCMYLQSTVYIAIFHRYTVSEPVTLLQGLTLQFGCDIFSSEDNLEFTYLKMNMILFKLKSHTEKTSIHFFE